MKKFSWLLSALICFGAADAFAQTADVQAPAEQTQQASAKDANDPSKVLPKEIADKIMAAYKEDTAVVKKSEIEMLLEEMDSIF